MTETLFDPAAEQRESHLPIPPLRLRRVVLYGVGPDGARFDPLDLDFATNDGAASRVLLSLTNTGGKSTLITLICSVIVPASRAQVGGKILGDYVLTGDTSHVVCEWDDAATDARIVTGTVMEWKDGRRQPPHKLRSTTAMHRAWYLFRTGPELPGIGDLPFVADGRRLPYRDFRVAIDDLIAAHPATRGVVEYNQHEWAVALDQRTSVDPILFEYQMRMNDSETGAKKLLSSFGSPDNIIRFFVTALNDDRELESFTGKLGAYSEVAGQRAMLESHVGFGDTIVPVLDIVSQRAAALEEATAAATRTRTRGGEHAGAIDNRIRADERSLTELTSAAEAAAQQLVRARRDYGQISDIRRQLQLEEARAKVVETETAAKTKRDAATAAEQRHHGWEAVDLVLDLATKRSAVAAAQQAYDAADAGLGPLRTATTDAVAAVAGKLDALIDEAAAMVESANSAATDAQRDRSSEKEAESDAHAALIGIDNQLTNIKRSLDNADRQRNQAITAGWLDVSESADSCVRRWQELRAEANRAAERSDTDAKSAAEREEQIGHRIEKVDGDLVKQRKEADSAAAALAAFDSELLMLQANDTIIDLAGGSPHDGATLNRVAELADTTALDSDALAEAHSATAEVARKELAHLDETGTAPTGPDIRAVHETLRAEGFGSVTGLHWIEHNILDADARAAFITAHPLLAGGVVVSDPQRFDAGVACLMQSELTTRTPVMVTTPPTTNQVDAPTVARHVVIPHRATWDRDWAARTRIELEATIETEQAAATSAQDAARRYRYASALCTSFLQRWRQTDREQLDADALSKAALVTSSETLRSSLVTDQSAARREAADARTERERELAMVAEADRHVIAATTLAGVEAEASAANARVPGLELEHIRIAEQREAAATAQADADHRYEAAIGQAAQARSAQDNYRTERATLGVDTATANPDGNLEVLRETWLSLREKLVRAERGMVEADALDRAHNEVGRAQSKTARLLPEIRNLAEELAYTIEASSITTRTGAQQRAKDDYNNDLTVALHAEAAHSRARADLAARQPAGSDHQNYFDLSGTEWAPATPHDIPQLLQRLEIRNAELLAARDTAEREATDAKELRDQVTDDIDSFADTNRLWVPGPIPTSSRFDGSATAARDLMREMLKAYQNADEDTRSAKDDLRAALTRVRAVAGGKDWTDYATPAAIRIRSLSDTDLVTEIDLLGRRVRAQTESARGDLADLDVHRSVLRDDLLSLCRVQRRLLRELSQSSRLPDGLGELSHNSAIKIRFEEAPDNEAVPRLARRIDSWADELTDNPKRAKSSEVRSRWLADAVRDTVFDRSRAGAWSIEILKPMLDGRVVYCPPDRIPHEFSGGQELTLAVLVYCALSRVRSAHRRGGARPAGTLLLDNPFGAASAEALIDIQHRLAAHCGVQLVCATGLNDPAVDAAFSGPGSVIVKLRNDGDLRRNLSFLRLRATVVDGVDVSAAIIAGRDPGSTQNFVNATSYEIRR